jgi:hypothetical protein
LRPAIDRGQPIYICISHSHQVHFLSLSASGGAHTRSTDKIHRYSSEITGLCLVLYASELNNVVQMETLFYRPK